MKSRLSTSGLENANHRIGKFTIGARVKIASWSQPLRPSPGEIAHFMTRQFCYIAIRMQTANPDTAIDTF